MGSARAAPATQTLAVTAGVVLSTLTLFALVELGPGPATAIAALPLLAVGIGLLVESGSSVLIASVFILPMIAIPETTQPLPLPGPTIFPQDVVLGLAVVSWAVGRLVYGRQSPRFTVPRTPVVGWPLLLFALAIVTATIRGHYAYGATLFGQPLRLVLYAAIIVTLAGMTVERLYRLLRAVLYGGAVITFLWATYYVATGTSQTDQVVLSTGGTRILGISVSLYSASAFFFALLSLSLSPRGSARMLHLTMAMLGLFGVVLGFGRAVFLATAIVTLLILVFARSTWSSLLSVVPLALPFLVIVGLMIPHVAPDLVDAAERRISAPPSTDANVQWRVEANKVVFAQVREQPFVGVGFGRVSQFFVPVDAGDGIRVPVRVELTQDPHNGYLYLLAGGGIAALGTFLLLLIVYAIDAVKRVRGNPDPHARVLVLWSAATLFALLLNAASGTTFTIPSDLVAIWLLLVLPAVVPYRAAAARNT